MGFLRSVVEQSSGRTVTHTPRVVCRLAKSFRECNIRGPCDGRYKLYNLVRVVSARHCNTMIIVVEGNIGAGKSTLLDVIGEKLASHLGKDRVVVLKEPIGEWCKNDLLKRFYKDIASTGLQLQLTVTLAMVEMERSAMDLVNEGKIVIMERSLMSAQQVFGEIVKRNPLVSKADKYLLGMFFDRFPPSVTSGRFGCAKYVRLHLRTPVAECLKRIRQRGRDGEEHITEEYLQDVEKHLERLVTRCGRHDTDHTIVMDGRYDKKDPMSVLVQRAECGFGGFPAQTLSLGGFLELVSRMS